MTSILLLFLPQDQRFFCITVYLHFLWFEWFYQ